jgi:RNA polymerase sigma-70 factor (ECF subfamily)
MLAGVHGPLTQPDAVTQARRGEPDGLAVLYESYAEHLFRLVCRLTSSTQDAEDIVHDVFLGLPEALRRYEERGSFKAWLTRVTVRHALMRMRSQRRRREVPLTNAVNHRRAAVGTDGGAGVDLHRAMARLPASLRTVLVLKQFEGYSHEEIAHLVGISTGASRTRYSRAVQTLRRMVREEP